MKSKGHKSDGLFRVSVDMGFEGARKALQSLAMPGLPRGAGPAKMLSAPGLCAGGTRDLHGGELRLVRFPCRSLKDSVMLGSNSPKKLQGEMSIYCLISRGRSC